MFSLYGNDFIGLWSNFTRFGSDGKVNKWVFLTHPLPFPFSNGRGIWIKIFFVDEKDNVQNKQNVQRLAVLGASGINNSLYTITT